MGRDPAYGNGKLNVLAAYQPLQAQPDFSVALEPAGAAVVAGGSTTYSVQVTPANGFSADVSLSLSGLSPTQGSWTFTPAVVPGGSGTSQLTVTTASAIPAGTYPLTVTAISGTTSKTTAASLTTTAPSSGDLAGPATMSPSLVPSPTNGMADAALHATGDDTATGGSNIAAAEYFTDALGADGTGTSMTVNAATPIASLDATILAATVNALAEGIHTLSVHAKDAAGNWGAMATTTLLLDRVSPSVTGAAATPNPTLGATTATLSATAVDTASGVNRAEWFTGADPGAGNAIPITTVSGTGP